MLQAEAQRLHADAPSTPVRGRGGLVLALALHVRAPDTTTPPHPPGTPSGGDPTRYCAADFSRVSLWRGARHSRGKAREH